MLSWRIFKRAGIAPSADLTRKSRKGPCENERKRQDDVSNRRPCRTVPTHGSTSRRTGGGSAQILARPVEHEASEGGSEREDGTPERGEEEGKGHGLGAHWTKRAATDQAREVLQSFNRIVYEPRHRGRDVPAGSKWPTRKREAKVKFAMAPGNSDTDCEEREDREWWKNSSKNSTAVVGRETETQSQSGKRDSAGNPEKDGQIDVAAQTWAAVAPGSKPWRCSKCYAGKLPSSWKQILPSYRRSMEAGTAPNAIATSPQTR